MSGQDPPIREMTRKIIETVKRITTEGNQVF